jgi:hypothetical protein
MKVNATQTKIIVFRGLEIIITNICINTGPGRMISWFWNVNKKGNIDTIENFISI